MMSEPRNPLPPLSALEWEKLIGALDMSAMLVVIDRRMSASLRREATSEDVLQEALMHAWRTRQSFEWRGLRSFRSWFLTIIDHRLCDLADHAKAAKRSSGGPLLALSSLHGDESAMAAGIPIGSTTPSRLAMHREQAAVMQAALDGLPDDLREIVHMRLFEQKGIEELAASTGLGESAVRHRFRKGAELYLNRLRAGLGSSYATHQLDSQIGAATPRAQPLKE